jgi:hypothetical protein
VLKFVHEGLPVIAKVSFPPPASLALGRNM